MNTRSSPLADYNGIFKENNKVYRDAIKALGLSDSAFWILYALREASGGITQSEIVGANYLPPQTINSALKKLEAEKYVELRSVRDKRKKLVVLTKKGEDLAVRTVDKVLAIEAVTMENLTPQEQEAFLGVFRKYTDLLKKNLSILYEESIQVE